jgi:hypothetical protein
MKGLSSEISRVNRLEGRDEVYVWLMALQDREIVEPSHERSHLVYAAGRSNVLAFNRNARPPEWYATANSKSVADFGRYKCNVYFMCSAASALKLDTVPDFPSGAGCRPEPDDTRVRGTLSSTRHS